VLLLSSIALSLPFVQKKIAQHFTNSINKDFGTNISIDAVRLSVFCKVQKCFNT
jgi:hypothetical protein